VIIPLQITWRDVAPSPAIEAAIRAKAHKLDQFSNHIVSCRVLIGTSHRHHHKGNPYHFRIEIEVPGKELVVRRDRCDKQSHDDIYVAIRDAFDAARRQLQDYVDVRRGHVKHHDEPL
jgi:ribosomal subunit interface protein